MVLCRNTRKSKLYTSLLSVEVSDAHLHEGTTSDVIASKCTRTDKPLPLQEVGDCGRVALMEIVNIN